jgi:hypothetical protein
MMIIYHYGEEIRSGTIIVLFNVENLIVRKGLMGGWKWIQTDHVLKEWRLRIQIPGFKNVIPVTVI